MYDIEKLYQAKDIGDAIRALKEDPEAVVISAESFELRHESRLLWF